MSSRRLPRIKRGQLIPHGRPLITDPRRVHGGRTAKTKRQYRNWGSFGPIPAQPILEFHWRMHKSQLVVQAVSRATGQSAILLHDILFRNICRLAIERAVDIFEQENFPRRPDGFIPQNSSQLRTDIINTLRNGYTITRDFPLSVMLGAPNTEHAQVVQRYKDPIQVKHQAGTHPSGRSQKDYNVRYADPNAEFSPFTRAKRRLLQLVDQQLTHLLSLNNISKGDFNLLVRTEYPQWRNV